VTDTTPHLPLDGNSRVEYLTPIQSIAFPDEWYEINAEEHFWFEWRESGGPSPEGEPKSRGFGTRLIERTLASELGGTVEMRFEPSGLVCRLTTSETDRIDASYEQELS